MIKTYGYGEEEQADYIRTISVLPREHASINHTLPLKDHSRRCSGFTIYCLSPSNLYRPLPRDLYNTPPNPFCISAEPQIRFSKPLGCSPPASTTPLQSPA